MGLFNRIFRDSSQILSCPWRGVVKELGLFIHNNHLMPHWVGGLSCSLVEGSVVSAWQWAQISVS